MHVSSLKQKEMTPLHFAAMNGQEVILLELIKHGANLDAQNFVSVHSY